MIVCTKCYQEKSTEDFPSNSEKMNGLSSWCNSCHGDQTTRHQSLRRSQIQDIKIARGCENPECVWGGPFIPSQLEFDHVRGVKVSSLSRMADQCRPWTEIEAEIAKCDVVCANCHRIRTEKRKNQNRPSRRVKTTGKRGKK